MENASFGLTQCAERNAVAARESAESAALAVRTVTDTINVAKSDIKERQKTPMSLMPPGLLEALPEREVVELLKFLTTEP